MFVTWPSEWMAKCNEWPSEYQANWKKWPSAIITKFVHRVAKWIIGQMQWFAKWINGQMRRVAKCNFVCQVKMSDCCIIWDSSHKNNLWSKNKNCQFFNIVFKAVSKKPISAKNVKFTEKIDFFLFSDHYLFSGLLESLTF